MSEVPAQFEMDETLTATTRTVADLMNVLSDGLSLISKIDDDDEREQALRFLLGLSDTLEADPALRPAPSHGWVKSECVTTRRKKVTDGLD